MNSDQRNVPLSWATLVGLCLALLAPVLINPLFRLVEDALIRRLALLLVQWLLTLLILALVLFWERLPLTSIGLKRPSGKDLLWGFLGFIIGAITFILTSPLVQALNLTTTTPGIHELAQLSLGMRLAIVVTAGITEEVMFRGYPIERLGALTGRPALGALLAYVIFVTLHIPFWGLGGALQIGVWSLVVTVLYLWRRNLPACILMHLLNDAYAFILLPMFFTQFLPPG